MEHQIPLTPEARADDPQQDATRHDGTHEIAPDLAYMRLLMVNVVLYGTPGTTGSGWTLIDAGLPGTAGTIIRAAEERFGEGARPTAIVLTHGHIDHIGALQALLDHWGDVPVYAHALEMPFLNGSASYPPPDTGVGNGIMPLLAGLFPCGPFDFRQWLRVLPQDSTVPGMPGWMWGPTPGHTPGHISLWRESDRTLIVGDAFITTNQESVYAVAIQKELLHGPPMYFTPDWASARTSVQTLAQLEPELVITGHGRAVQGPELREALHTLARDFDQIAIPEQGKYVLPGS